MFQSLLNVCVILSLAINSWLLFRLGQEAKGVNKRLDKVEHLIDNAQSISATARGVLEDVREGEATEKSRAVRERLEEKLEKEAKRKLGELLEKL